MLKIILFAFVILFIILLTFLGKAALNKINNKKTDEQTVEPSTVKEMIEELESKITYYKKVAEEGNMLAKSKLAFYEQELMDIKNLENKIKL